MASAPGRTSGDEAGAGAPQPSSHQADESSDRPGTSPVEMSSLQSQSQWRASIEQPPETTSNTSMPPPPAAPLTESRPAHTSPAQEVSDSQPAVTQEFVVSRPTSSPALHRTDTEAIGPSTDTPTIQLDPSPGNSMSITLLLTNGARHPYRLDEKYLRKRNVTVEDMDPRNISVYTLKELIWRDWREECRFSAESPNVVHMTIKPHEANDEEDNAQTGKGGGRQRETRDRSPGCRCVIL